MTQPKRLLKRSSGDESGLVGAFFLGKCICETKANPLKVTLECLRSDAGPQLHLTVTFYLPRLYQCPPHRLAVTCMPIQSECFASPRGHLHQECFPPPSAP